MNRRQFLTTGLAAAASSTIPFRAYAQSESASAFDISLAEWSLHRTIRQGKLDNLEFPAFAKSEFGITAVEYVNGFFKDKAKDTDYLKELKKRCDDIGSTSVLIMIDGEGALGGEEKERTAAVDNHKKWVEAAKFLGCHSIRVNAAGKGSAEEVAKRAIDGLRSLSEFAAPHGIGVIVENHGGHSSNGAWLANVIESVGLDNCGTLPDFGNFHSYDRYKGLKETMPYAKGVSAKSHEFNEAGEEVRTDFRKAIDIVLAAGYHGYIGIEYEGKKHSEIEGIKLTQSLLEKIRKEKS